MKFTKHSSTTGVMILANDHYTAKTYDCTGLDILAADNVIPAGTIIPANDSTAVGVLLSDVNLKRNPNGTIVTHGFIRMDKLPAAPSDEAKAAMKLIELV